MALATPLNQKTNQNPCGTIHKDAKEIDNENHMFPFYFLIMMPNTIGSFARAYRHNDYSLAFLCLLVFSTILIFDYCLSKYLSIPKNEKSSQKLWLKLTMWFLYTALSFGFVYQFANFLTLHSMMVLYMVVLVCSASLFYILMILDLVSDSKIRSSLEVEIGVHKNQMLDAGKSNYADSVMEKV